MQRALSSVLRRSLLQQRAVAQRPAVLVNLARSRQFSATSFKLSDNFAGVVSTDDSGSTITNALRDDNSTSTSSNTDASAALPTYRLFIGGLDPQTGDADLLETFEKFGEVVKANVVRDRETDRSKRFGFVHFTSEQPVLDVLADTSVLSSLGASVSVERATEPKPRRNSFREGSSRDGGMRRQQQPRAPPSDTLFIAGFPPHLTKAELNDAIAEFFPADAIVRRLSVPRPSALGEEADESRQNKGFFFIQMGSVDEAQGLLRNLISAATDGWRFPGENKPSTFRFANPENNNEQRASSRSFGGDGGRSREYKPRRLNNSWINEERSRFSSGGGDSY